MKANNYLRIESLLNTLESDQKCKLNKLFEALNLEYIYQSRIEWNNASRAAFIASWQKYDALKESFGSVCTKVMKGKKAKDFIKANETFVSGYSMGETVEIVINYNVDGVNLSNRFVIVDNCKKYANSCKWNNKITYGCKKLICDYNGKSYKYEVDEQIKKGY